MFLERNYFDSQGSHYIIPKINNQKYKITETGYKIEVGPGETYVVINKISLPYCSGRPVGSKKV